MEYTICYVSTAAKSFEEDEIKDLFESWKKKNGEDNVKGILLYSQGHFFQVLEGEKKKVLTLYKKIEQDQRHHEIIQVLGKEIDRGSIDHYVTDYLSEGKFTKENLVEHYCKSVRGMDQDVQMQIRSIMESFIDTRVL